MKNLTMKYTNIDRENLAVARATMSLIDDLAGFSPMTKAQALVVLHRFWFLKKHSQNLLNRP